MFTVGLGRHRWLIRDNIRRANSFVLVSADWPIDFAAEHAECHCSLRSVDVRRRPVIATSKLLQQGLTLKESLECGATGSAPYVKGSAFTHNETVKQSTEFDIILPFSHSTKTKYKTGFPVTTFNM